MKKRVRMLEKERNRRRRERVRLNAQLESEEQKRVRLNAQLEFARLGMERALEKRDEWRVLVVAVLAGRPVEIKRIPPTTHSKDTGLQK